MSTRFRNEFIIYIALFSLSFLLQFYKLGCIILLTTILFWLLQRSNEKTLFQIIKQDLMEANKDSNIKKD